MTRNPRLNLPKNFPNPLNDNNHNRKQQQQYDNDDFNVIAASKSMIMTASKQQEEEFIDTKHKHTHNQDRNRNHNHADERNSSEMLERGRKRKFRYFVASLGLTVAAVNCYAQATFCIAIVEMVLPADYVLKGGESGSQTTVHVVSNNSNNSHLHSLPNQPAAPVEELETLSCPVEYKYRDYYDAWRFPNTSTSTSTSTTSQQPASLADLLSKAAPAVVAASSSAHVIDISNRFDWDASRQGLLLGAFAMGMAPLQVLGGRLAEIYGAKWVLLVGCIGTALTNLTIPVLAHFSYTMLVVNRVLMGVAQAGMEPGLMCLMAQWLAPAETGFFISMLLFALCIGFFLGSLLSSFLLTVGLGWPLTYYVTGGLNLIMSIVWLVYASKGPEESLLISEEERAYIRHEQQQERAKSMRRNKEAVNNDLSITTATATSTIQDISSSCSNEQAPWMNILRTPSVWAFIICKISVRWCADVLTIELPTYLANVLHLSIKLNGILNSLSSAFFAIFSFITGYFVNELLKRTHEAAASEQERLRIGGNNNCSSRNAQQQHQLGAARRSLMSKTTLRKSFQSVASFGSAIAIFLMTHYDCNIQLSMSMMFVLSACLMMGTGGELQIPYDMTSRYPGTLHGMACTLSVSGWLAPPLIGLILGDQPSSRHRWSIVWYLTASINFVGGLVFVLFADASPRNFDKRAPSGGKKAAAHLHLHHHHTQNNNGAAIGAPMDNNGQSKATLLHHNNHHHHQHHQNMDSTCSGPVQQTNLRCVVSSSVPRPLDVVPTSTISAPTSNSIPASAAAAGTFDGGELLKIRQLEGSLSASSSRLDSLLAGQSGAHEVVMLPYQSARGAGGMKRNGLAGRMSSSGAGLLAWFSANSRRRQKQRQQLASRKLNGVGHILCQGFQPTAAAGPPPVAAAAVASVVASSNSIEPRRTSGSKIITRL